MKAPSSSTNPFDSIDERMMHVVSLADHSAMLGSAGAVTFENAQPVVPSSVLPMDPIAAPTSETAKERKRRHRQYIGLARQELLTYEKANTLAGWSSVACPEGSGITCDELPVTKDGIYTFRAMGVVHGKKAQEIAERHLDCNPDTRLRWDKELSHIELVEHITRDDRAGILLTCQRALHDPPSPVSDREFVYIQFSFSKPSRENKFDKRWTILVTSVDHPLCPVHSDPVRALMMSVMVLEPFAPDINPDTKQSTPNTAVTLYGWVNPGGWIPPAIVKLYKTKLADRIAFLRETLFLDEPLIKK